MIDDSGNCTVLQDEPWGKGVKSGQVNIADKSQIKVEKSTPNSEKKICCDLCNCSKVQYHILNIEKLNNMY